jgi:hypothetical protein
MVRIDSRARKVRYNDTLDIIRGISIFGLQVRTDFKLMSARNNDRDTVIL